MAPAEETYAPTSPIETKFDKPFYKLIIGFQEVKRFFQESTRSRIRRIIDLLHREESERMRANALDHENKELKSTLDEQRQELETAISRLAKYEEEVQQLDSKNKELFQSSTMAYRLQIEVGSLQRKLQSVRASKKKIIIQEKLHAAQLVAKALERIEYFGRTLREREKELKELFSTLKEPLTERGEMPLIIEVSHFREAEDEIEAIKNSFHTTTDDQGNLCLLIENPVFDKAVAEYLEAIEIKEDPTQWTPAFEKMLQAVGYFKAAKLFEDLMLSQYEEESGGVSAEQQQAINLLKTKHSDWVEGTEKGEWLRNFYSILGVEPTATKSEITKVFRQKAAKHHPDKNEGNHNGEFASINSAGTVLRSDELREEYDHYYKIFF